MCGACVRAINFCAQACRFLPLLLNNVWVGVRLLCAGAWVLRDFMFSLYTFVRRLLGFERFYAFGIVFLCAGAWVLRGFTIPLYNFCAQALGFEAILCILN